MVFEIKRPQSVELFEIETIETKFGLNISKLCNAQKT